MPGGPGTLRTGTRLVFGGLTLLAALNVVQRAHAGVVHGQTDQNQPLALKVDRAGGYLRSAAVLRCRVATTEEGTPDQEQFVIRRVSTRLRIWKGNRLEAQSRVRRHRRPPADEDLDQLYGLLHRRSLMLITVSARAPSTRAAAGTIRVRLAVREVRTDTEVGPIPYRVLRRCDSGVRRWRVPRVRFFGRWRPTGSMIAPTGPMNAPSEGGTPLALPDGRVLLPGDAQLYEPRRNRWKRAGTPVLGRRSHATRPFLGTAEC